MFCTNCGKTMDQGSAFCVSCGTKVSQADPAGAIQSQMTAAIGTQAGVFQKSKKKIVMLGAVVLVLIAAVLIFQWITDDSGHPEIGSIISFGGYDWRVLDVQDGRALLLSEYIIEHRAYHNRSEAVTWETSTLRHYLNNQFFNSFNESDRARIAETRVLNNNNPWRGTHGGNDTNDRIFLLSIEEVVRYFGDSGELRNREGEWSEWAIYDRYNFARIARTRNGEASWWWLRSPGLDSYCAAGVNSGGILDFRGLHVVYGSGGVRPALWLNL